MNYQIGNIIKLARQNKNMTQEELAEKLNITSQAVSKWERNVSIPDTGILAGLCKTLDISADFLIGRVEANNTESSCEANNQIFHELQNCWPALELYFGQNIVPIFGKQISRKRLNRCEST